MTITAVKGSDPSNNIPTHGTTSDTLVKLTFESSEDNY